LIPAVVFHGIVPRLCGALYLSVIMAATGFHKTLITIPGNLFVKPRKLTPAFIE